MFTDEQRLKFIMRDLDSYFGVKKDRFDYAQDVAYENGKSWEEADSRELLEGFRRMLDAAMVHYNFKG